MMADVNVQCQFSGLIGILVPCTSQDAPGASQTRPLGRSARNRPGRTRNGRAETLPLPFKIQRVL
jgi:hypothetical protein